MNLVVESYHLTQFVPVLGSFTINGGNKACGYLETPEGQTVPNVLASVQFDYQNGQNYSPQIILFPEFGTNIPGGDGNQGQGAMADFKMTTDQLQEGADNWLRESNNHSNDNLDQVNLSMSGHTVTMKGNAPGLGDYSVTADVETQDSTEAGADPAALDFLVKVTKANSSTLNSVDPALVANTLFQVIEKYAVNSADYFIHNEGDGTFKLVVNAMPSENEIGVGNLDGNDDYGHQVWQKDRILVAVNWTTGTFYFDYPGSTDREVPIELDD